MSLVSERAFALLVSFDDVLVVLLGPSTCLNNIDTGYPLN